MSAIAKTFWLLMVVWPAFVVAIWLLSELVPPGVIFAVCTGWACLLIFFGCLWAAMLEDD